MTEDVQILALRIHDAAKAMSISRSSIYNMIRDGRLRPVKIVGRTLIPRSEIDRLLSGVVNNA